jgi:hypothetical protein
LQQQRPAVLLLLWLAFVVASPAVQHSEEELRGYQQVTIGA